MPNPSKMSKLERLLSQHLHNNELTTNEAMGILIACELMTEGKDRIKEMLTEAGKFGYEGLKTALAKPENKE
jgi:hypothetical protein